MFLKVADKNNANALNWVIFDNVVITLTGTTVVTDMLCGYNSTKLSTIKVQSPEFPLVYSEQYHKTTVSFFFTSGAGIW